jgi:hypothetical protein
VAHGATAAVTSTGIRAALDEAPLAKLATLADDLVALQAAAGARGTARRQFEIFWNGRSRRHYLPIDATALKAWVTHRMLTHISERGPSAGQLVHGGGVKTLLDALRSSFAGDPAGWHVTADEFAATRRLCDQLRAAVPVTAAPGKGLPVDVLQRLHARLRADGSPAARRLRAWLALVVGLALRGKDVDTLRWRELRASAALGLGMLPDAPKSGRFVLRRGEPRAAPHVPAALGDFCALRALQEYAPARTAALLRTDDMGDAYVFLNDAAARWPAAAALAHVNRLLVGADAGYSAGKHIGRDSSQALWQGQIGLTREQRNLAGGWKPPTVIATHYESPTPEVLMALLAGEVARQHGGGICCAAAQGAAPPATASRSAARRAPRSRR